MKLSEDYEFEPGNYYVGDLCYYLDDDRWEQLLEVSKFEDGIYTLPDGRVFCWFGTAFGDGEYYDQKGRSYCVDSGTIGLIKVTDNQKSVLGGNIIEFKAPFSVNGTARKNGVIRFGSIRIDTDPDPEYD